MPEPLFNKVSGWKPTKRLAEVFSHQFCEFFKNKYFGEHLRGAASSQK